MPRRSLRPELNRIRGWVRQGRTDAWIAHQLEVTVQQIQAFKREQALEPDADPETPVAVSDFDDEIDLRAEDDALIAAELDAEAQAAAAKAAASSQGGKPLLQRRPRPPRPPRRTRMRTATSQSVGVADARPPAPAAPRAESARPAAPGRPPSITVKRASGCGSIPPCRTTRSTPSPGPGTARLRSRSRRTRS